MGLAIDREGYSVARWLTQRGVAAFVLKYRVAPMPADPQEASLDFERRMEQYATLAREDGATANDHPSSQEQIKLFAAAREDGLEAVRYVRAHASQWGLSAHRVGMMGFSAGAVVTTDVTLQADDPSRPDLIAPIYGMLPDKTPVLSNAPPAFIAAAADDWVAPFSLAIYNAWRASGVAAELHVFENGGHGFGVLQQGRSSDQWAQAFDRWLAAHGFARPAHQTNPV
jgi:acetyl esterase/lipase